MGASRGFDVIMASARRVGGAPPVSGRGRLRVCLLRGGVALLGVLVGAAVARGQGPGPAGSHPVRAVRAVGLTVSSLERSIDFYCEIVGAEVGQEYYEQEGGPISLAILRIGRFALSIRR